MAGIAVPANTCTHPLTHPPPLPTPPHTHLTHPL